MTNLSGHIALVTGASKSIGQASAVALAGAGADIVVHYAKARRRRARRSKSWDAAFVTHADVSVAGEVNAMHAQVNQGFGAPDILVNNAGMAQRKELDEIDEAVWNRIIDVNLKSVFLMIRTFLPAMRQKRWGRIIDISSGWRDELSGQASDNP
jgi:3-oxoacyl-[acyl-carrier protein] reductase